MPRDGRSVGQRRIMPPCRCVSQPGRPRPVGGAGGGRPVRDWQSPPLRCARRGLLSSAMTAVPPPGGIGARQGVNQSWTGRTPAARGTDSPRGGEVCNGLRHPVSPHWRPRPGLRGGDNNSKESGLPHVWPPSGGGAESLPLEHTEGVMQRVAESTSCCVAVLSACADCPPKW